jgi:hypothetical protein
MKFLLLILSSFLSNWHFCQVDSVKISIKPNLECGALAVTLCLGENNSVNYRTKDSSLVFLTHFHFNRDSIYNATSAVIKNTTFSGRTEYFLELGLDSASVFGDRKKFWHDNKELLVKSNVDRNIFINKLYSWDDIMFDYEFLKNNPMEPNLIIEFNFFQNGLNILKLSSASQNFMECFDIVSINSKVSYYNIDLGNYMRELLSTISEHINFKFNCLIIEKTNKNDCIVKERIIRAIAAQ